MRKITVADAIGDEQDDVVAADFVVFESQHAFGIGADAEGFGFFVGDVIAAFEIFRRAREFEFGAVEFIHGGGADEPGADADAGGGGFEEGAFVFVTGKFSPAMPDDFAIETRAHVAEDVRFHAGTIRGRRISARGNLKARLTRNKRRGPASCLSPYFLRCSRSMREPAGALGFAARCPRPHLGACRACEVMAAQQELVTVLGQFDSRLVKMAPGGERPEG